MKTIKEIYEGINITTLPIKVLARLKYLSELEYQPKYHLNEEVVFEDKLMYVNSIRAGRSATDNPDVEYLLSYERNKAGYLNYENTIWLKGENIMTPSEYRDLEINRAKELLIKNGYKVEL